ncbi:thioredoxin family protein [Mariniblastus fucicola]|uniref:Thioredoxin n=1 Tax=Mariniblastus fucicola TaxID=980251 RepID=A0A5B9P762_9BACT|nr:thioredoxin family protein [Mariniblastus fucicola]QEG22467.1 Thioredoxin [Mariniblastus fucicola]
MKRNRILVIALSAIFSLAPLSVSTHAQEIVQFHSSIEDARDSLGPDESAKPIVLYFGASWCAPCQKMRTVTLEFIKNDENAGAYQWVKYDIDDSPEMASNFGIVSVPTIVVLDSLENPVGKTGGFMTAENLLEFVSNSINNPTPIPPTIDELAEGIAEANDSELNDAVDLLIREMADPRRADRQRMLSIVKEHKQRIQPRLIDWLEDNELRSRAAAGLAISAVINFKSDFDPFADPATRKVQIDKIQKSLLDAD